MSYGQFNEDEFILSQYTQSVGFAIEVGGADGINGSPTKCLEERGWKTLLIEPNPELFKIAKQNRPYVYQCAAGNENIDDVGMTIYTLDGGNQTAVSGLKPNVKLIEQHQHLIKDQYLELVNQRTLNSLIKQWGEDLGEPITNIDFLSIDTEGTELDVIAGISLEHYKPKIIALENNFEDHNYRRTMFNYGYVLYERIGVNDYYIEHSYVPKMESGMLDLRDLPFVKRMQEQHKFENDFKVFNI
jgi:FkbM family methyltransferase